MPLPGRIFAGDEELGKKNDDHKPRKSLTPVSPWPILTTKGPRLRPRRVLLGLIACLILYVFVKNIPTDLGPSNERYDLRVAKVPSERGSPTPSEAPSGEPPHPVGQAESEKHYYNGQIRFYWLAASLHAIARTAGYRESNKNVLFAAGNLQSASRLIPMACEMSRWNRNFVHFAFTGRDDLPFSAIQEVNGAGIECDIFWHDARPDYPPWSSDYRMEVSVNAALGHMQSFMHPQVIITDDSSHEEAFFVKGLRSKAHEIGRSIIELPSDAANRLRWITRLDSGSLSAWHKTYVDILIQAPAKSSGSLIRLLRSIEAADYFGARRPHLTIELPADIDFPSWQYLENLVWPPIDPSGAPHISQVTLRHRVSSKKLSSEEASSHFVESFYPARPKDSHVLFLSSQVELSPLYYHYLFYNTLEYKYSSYASHNRETEDLMGLSLEIPSTYLNDSVSFNPPSSALDEEPISFLWQAPNANAALYFGNKWAEFHSFLCARISAHNHRPRPKVVSEKFPAWTEYLLELMRARGYSLLYPNLPSSAIVTVHNELYQFPEEFSNTSPSTSTPDSDAPQDLDPDEAFTIDPAIHLQGTSINLELPLLETSLLSLLPQDGDLPDLLDVPLLDYAGELLKPAQSINNARSFAQSFRRTVGGCAKAATSTKAQRPMSANDLFCIDDGDEEDGVVAPKESVSKHSAPKESATSKSALKDNAPKDSAPKVAVQKETVLGADGEKDTGNLIPENTDTKGEFEAHLQRQGGKRATPG